MSSKIKEECNLNEPIYDISYSQEKIPEKFLKLMRNPKPINKISKDYLDLPVENIFLPRDLEMIKAPHPIGYVLSDYTKLWYQFN